MTQQVIYQLRSESIPIWIHKIKLDWFSWKLSNKKVNLETIFISFIYSVLNFFGLINDVPQVFFSVMHWVNTRGI